MKTDVIEQSIQLWKKEPEKAKVHSSVKARSDGMLVTIEADVFTWQSDLPQALGGENKAASPTALLLGALSGCAVLFIRDTLAPLLGVQIESVQAEARCTSDFRGLLGMSYFMPDLRDIEINIHVQSTDSEEKIQRLYRAWLERCPIYHALRKPMTIKTTFTRTR
jgi:uncharacterized OsmC-like protein